MATDLATNSPTAADASAGRTPGNGDCWNQIGIAGDRTCPELNQFVHCRNCPVFTAAARTFFDRPAPEGYLADWAKWLARSAGQETDDAGVAEDQDGTVSEGEAVSVLIFRLGEEWLAFRTNAVASVTVVQPVHRVPGRSNQVFVGLVNLEGQVQLCVSLHGLLGIAAQGSSSRLIVLHDQARGETWAFGADQVLKVQRVPRSQWHSPPATLANPAVAFSQAVVSWSDRSIGVLDERRIFAALRSLGREQ
jgi:chemotaxis-related protein WspD